MRKRLRIVWQAAEKFAADDGWAIASYIGLTLLTSLFPFLIFVAAVAGFFGSSDLAHEAAKLVFAEWPDVVARPIADEVERVLTTPRSGGLLTFGAVFSFYFASSAIEALRVGLNRAYGLVEPRPWWMLRLQSLGLVLIGSIALLALAFLVVLGPLIVDTLGAFFPAVAQARGLLTFLRIGVAALMLGSSLILAHLILPAHRVGFRDILPGVALTFIASIAFGEAFGAYLSEYLRNYISTYAGLASVMIALVYLYWVALLFVFGGEFNAAIIRARQARRDDRGALLRAPVPAFDWARTAGLSQSPCLEVFQHGPDRSLLFVVHLIRVEVHEKDFGRLLALDAGRGRSRLRRPAFRFLRRRGREGRFRGSPARRQRPRLPALEHAAAYFHARIVRGVKEECHALLDDRVRSRESLPERLVEMGRGSGLEVDREHRGVFLPQELQKLLGPTPVAVRVHQLLQALRRAPIDPRPGRGTEAHARAACRPRLKSASARCGRCATERRAHEDPR